MNEETRNRFDRQLERVMDRLPEKIRLLIGEIPLIVEDFPSRKILREQGLDDPLELCGLFEGVPCAGDDFEESPWSSGVRSPVIYLYRLGIMEASRNPETGRVNPELLREEIRITIFHEIGHYYGMDEDELEEYGYG